MNFQSNPNNIAKTQPRNISDSFSYLFAWVIDEEDAVIEGFGLALFLDLKLGIVYGIAREEAPFLRQQFAVFEAKIEALRCSPELGSAEESAGDGVARRCYHSRRRHLWLLVGVVRENSVVAEFRCWPQMVTSGWLLLFLVLYIPSFYIIIKLFFMLYFIKVHSHYVHGQ